MERWKEDLDRWLTTEPDDPWDDDAYWINQREADDYRHEGDDVEGDDEDA
jgi:hypothetical protein